MTQNMVRTLESEIDIDAPIATVWELVGDVANAPKWSPSTTKVVPLGGRTANGTFSINVNKEGFLIWPTTAKVIDYVPGKRLSNRVINGTEWVFELSEGPGGEGTTTLKQYRDIPPAVLKFWESGVARLTGGEDKFTPGLAKGVSASLKRIKSLAEQQ